MNRFTIIIILRIILIAIAIKLFCILIVMSIVVIYCHTISDHSCDYHFYSYYITIRVSKGT